MQNFPDFEEKTCEKCQMPDEDLETKPKFDPTILALKILNRCFTFQIEAIILNQTEPLIRQVKEDT